MTAYYNENDPKAAAWLRELIKHGHIAAGDVDERSIEDVLPNDIRGYTQCHFFAGIGGWSYALRLAGWPDDRPVWTGSCPCQPFSAAGKRKGFADERHLWPAWFHLIRECRPERIFGEQVARAMLWIDLVQRDLEAEDYACGYIVLGAHSVGAPHIRQRLYWMAHRHCCGRIEYSQRDGPAFQHSEKGASWLDTGGCRELRLAHADGERLEALSVEQARGQRATVERGGALDSCWSRVTWLPCHDGKRRPVEPGSFPLAHGVPERVGLLRGYGNAIVPQVAAAFIRASIQTHQGAVA